MLTLGYPFLTALGMFHRALVFLMFRINIFDYAEPSDFLLAALPLYVITALLWALAASLQYVTSVARDLRAGTGRRVQVELIAGSQVPSVDTMPQLLLGTTQKFLFLYDAPKQITSVIPISNIARLRFDRRKTTTTPPVARARQ